MEIFLSLDTWLLLLTLTFLEIVLGIDNIVFISILSNKLPPSQRGRVSVIGLLFAMLQRIVLLFFVSSLVELKSSFLSIDNSWFKVHLNWQSVILFLGGIFLLYNSTKEIYEKTENKEFKQNSLEDSKLNSFSKAIVQILIIDFVFSIDSILTAVGMTVGINKGEHGALILMIIAVVISIVIMIVFVNSIRRFIEKHPSIQLLALAFLILIGFMLITEAAHSCHLVVFENEVHGIPKTYLYFAISFSLFVEFLNIRSNKKPKKS